MSDIKKYIEKFEIDWHIVKSMLKIIRIFNISDNMAKKISPIISDDIESTFISYLWASAICHATKGGLKGKINNLFFNGSDFLIQIFIKIGSENPHFIDTIKFSKISGNQLKNLFFEYSTEQDITLDDFDRRSEILNQCASELNKYHQGSITNLLNKTNHKIGGKNGAYSLLSHLSAFKDKQKKKSTVFLMNVYFSRLWKIEDEENINPMIDYHRIRLLLRTGCIRIIEPELFHNKLISKELIQNFIEEDLRFKSFEITKFIVKELKMNSFVIDMLLWAFARSCCREKPICVYQIIENESFYSFIKNPYRKKCEFESFCISKHNKILRDLWEPIINTENY